MKMKAVTSPGTRTGCILGPNVDSIKIILNIWRKFRNCRMIPGFAQFVQTIQHVFLEILGVSTIWKLFLTNLDLFTSSHIGRRYTGVFGEYGANANGDGQNNNNNSSGSGNNNGTNNNNSNGGDTSPKVDQSLPGYLQHKQYHEELEKRRKQMYQRKQKEESLFSPQGEQKEKYSSSRQILTQNANGSIPIPERRKSANLPTPPPPPSGLPSGMESGIGRLKLAVIYD
jgi:hypothetical protein